MVISLWPQFLAHPIHTRSTQVNSASHPFGVAKSGTIPAFGCGKGGNVTLCDPPHGTWVPVAARPGCLPKANRYSAFLLTRFNWFECLDRCFLICPVACRICTCFLPATTVLPTTTSLLTSVTYATDRPSSTNATITTCACGCIRDTSLLL